ncbi:MAG: MerC domain-containing protein [Pseudomonadota bacterium]|nr:MerC domain-containing protein [Pseudomonadota bacterium]
MIDAARVDKAAIGFSFICIVHCAILPVIAVGLPLLGQFAEAEWIHWLFTSLAIGAAIFAVITAKTARSASFVVPASAGILALIFALVAEPLGLDETIPTVAGAMLLAGAHFYRLFTNH